MHGIHDRGRHAGGNGHREKGGADAFTCRQTETDIGGATGRVHFQLVFKPAQEPHDLHSGLVDGADWHDERVHNHVAGGNAVVGSPLHDFLGYFETHIGILGNSGLIV